MVFFILDIRNSVRILGFLAIALASNVYAVSCDYPTSSNYNTIAEASAACQSDSYAGCYRYDTCTWYEASQRFSWISRNSQTYSEVWHHYNFVPPPPPPPECEQGQEKIKLVEFPWGNSPTLSQIQTVSSGNCEMVMKTNDAVSECFFFEYVNGQQSHFCRIAYVTTGATIEPTEIVPLDALPTDGQVCNGDCRTSNSETLRNVDDTTLPDGSTQHTDTQTTIENINSGGVTTETTENTVLEQFEGTTVQVTTTTTTTTNPDGTVTVEETVSYSQAAGGSTTTTVNNNSGTPTTTTTPPSEPSTGTTTTTTTTNPDGSSTTVINNYGGGGGGAGGAAEGAPTPGSESGDEPPQDGTATVTGPEIGEIPTYSQTLTDFSNRLSAAPLVAATAAVFTQSMPSGNCPTLSLNLPYVGSIGTDMHCVVMGDFSSSFYPLMLGLWGLAGVMLFLRA